MTSLEESKKIKISLFTSATMSLESFIVSQLKEDILKDFNQQEFNDKIDIKIIEFIQHYSDFKELNDPKIEKKLILEKQDESQKNYKNSQIIMPIKQCLELLLKDFICFMMDEHNFNNFVDITKFKNHMKIYHMPFFLVKNNLNESFLKYMEIVMVQFYQFTCTFKFFWLHFFINDYYDCLDNNYFDLEFYKDKILKRSIKVPRQLNLVCLKNLIEYLNFFLSPLMQEYCCFVGVAIF